MYCNNYHFSRKPFDVTPDPEFLYLSPDHTEVLAALVYGITERRGFIVIIGEVGTGKTTVINAALDKLGKKTKVAYVFNTDVTFEQMLQCALVDLGLATHEETLSKTEAINRLNEFAIQQLTENGNVVFIVDEAQNLDLHTMENLRLLSNLETRKHKLIQIVLSGQPELDVKLGRHELRQFTQRISVRRYITPLNEDMVYEYIKHRLAIAGCQDSSLFSHKAQQLIWQFSGGVPRKINILCDNALLIGYGLRKKRIGAKEIEEAIRDLSCSPFSNVEATRMEDPRPAEPRPVENPVPPLVTESPVDEKTKPFSSRFLFPVMTTLTVVAFFVFIVGYLLGSYQLDSSLGAFISGGDTQAEHIADKTPGRSTDPAQQDKGELIPEVAVMRPEKQFPDRTRTALVKPSNQLDNVDQPPLNPPLPDTSVEQDISAREFLNSKKQGRAKEKEETILPLREDMDTDKDDRFAGSPDRSAPLALPNSGGRDRAEPPSGLSHNKSEELPAGLKSKTGQKAPVEQEMTIGEVAKKKIAKRNSANAKGFLPVQDIAGGDDISATPAIADHPSTKVSFEYDTQREPVRDLRPETKSGSVPLADNRREEKSVTHPRTVIGENDDKPQGQKANTVIAAEGDVLSAIISRTYGEFNDTLLFKVLKENPKINNPNLIYVDQTIKLPVLKADP